MRKFYFTLFAFVPIDILAQKETSIPSHTNNDGKLFCLVQAKSKIGQAVLDFPIWLNVHYITIEVATI